MLYLIGLGLNDEEDLSLKAINIMKKCDEIYCELYTGMSRTTMKAEKIIIMVFKASREPVKVVPMFIPLLAGMYDFPMLANNHTPAARIINVMIRFLTSDDCIDKYQ